MQASNFFPPITEKKPLSEQELERISYEIQRLTGGTALKIIIGLGIALLIALFLGRQHGNESLIGQFGLFRGLFIVIALVAIPVLWAFLSSRNKLRKDLEERAKIIRQTAIVRKEQSFRKRKIYARIDAEEPGFHEFEIDGAVYEKLELGQKVRLEYALNSKCLLNIELQE